MKRYKLGEIAKDVSSGATPSRNKLTYWENGNIPWLKTEQIGQYKIKNTNEHISQQAVKETALKLYPKNTISIAMYGEGRTRGNVSITDCELTTNQACCNIVVNNDIVEPFYLYYFLKTQYQNFRNLSSGIRKNLNTNIIKNYDIYLPSKEKQIKVSNLLKSIDDKIAINNQINAILERVAKAIYEYYFVQFDFPDNQGKPYKSSGGAMRFDPTLNRPIPKDFEMQNLNKNSLTSIIPPNIEIFEGEKVYLPTANIQNDKIADFSNKITYKNRESRANMQPIANSVWFAKMKKSKKVLYFADYSQEWIDNLILSTGFYGLHCKNNSLEYIWNTINSTHFENQKDRLAHGATQQAVNNDDLLSIPLLIPTNEVIENFHNQVKSFYKQKYINEIENQKLKNLRDFLLPLLINAQVQI